MLGVALVIGIFGPRTNRIALETAGPLGLARIPDLRSIHNAIRS
jgi:hypothetical protein